LDATFKEIANAAGVEVERPQSSKARRRPCWSRNREELNSS
jgi:hypothetical protein